MLVAEDVFGNVEINRAELLKSLLNKVVSTLWFINEMHRRS